MNRFVERDSRLGAFPPGDRVSGDPAEILEQLRREVARRCPEWMELGAEDPRAVLLEVFAEALAGVQTRVDHLDDGLFPRLLDALGEEPRRVVPAQGAIQFVTRADVSEAVRVPRGTVVSAPRRRGQAHIAYETTADGWCSSARLLRVVTSDGSSQREWIPFPQSGWDRCSGSFPAERVRPQRYLYLGDPVLSTLRSEAGHLVLEWPDLAADGDGRHLIEGDWECTVEGAWRKIRVEWEQVGASTPVLRARLRGPVHDITEQPVDGLSSVWLRCAFSGGVGIRLPTPEWVSSSAVSTGSLNAGRVVFNFPRLVAKVLTRHEETWRDHSFGERRRDGAAAPREAFGVARCPAEWDTAVYVGWDRPAAASIYWQLEGDPSSYRTIPERGARYAWEYSGTDGFSPFEVEDGTAGFSRSGSVAWEAPSRWTAQELHGEKLFWLRARWTAGGYVKPPRLSAIVPHAVGIRQGRVVENVIHEVDFDARGRGRVSASCADGEPESIDSIELQGESGTWVTCRLDGTDAMEGDDAGEAPDEAPGEPSDEARPSLRVRRLPAGVLEIEAGPSWRGPISVRFPRVRFCHGKQGDLPAGALRILESDHPDVAEVIQPLATSGGMDSETSEELRARVVAEWSASHRIVTLRDLRLMCQALDPEVARVEAAVDPEDSGLLRVTVVPFEPHRRSVFSSHRLRWLEEELQDRLPIGTVVEVREPAYLRVEVVGRQRGDGHPPPPPRSVCREIELRLEEFFHPLDGGVDRRGLPASRWLPEEGGFASLMSRILAPRGDSGLPGTEEATVARDWPIGGWRFDLVVPGGGFAERLPATWRQRAATEAGIVFPILDRLRFEGA